jgi:hypothetical protein
MIKIDANRRCADLESAELKQYGPTARVRQRTDGWLATLLQLDSSTRSAYS